MHKDVVYARLYAAFFQEHPEMLTEVRYIPIPDGDEHELSSTQGRNKPDLPH